MLNRIFPQIKFLLALLFFAFLPVLVLEGTAQAGFPPTQVAVTDSEAGILAGYWDLRSRKTIFQVTNTSTAPVRVHIQVFDTTVGSNCAEFDFFDDFTPFDTHVYDLSNLDRNNGVPLAAPDLSGGHGAFAVTTVDSSGDIGFNIFGQGGPPGPFALTGNLRIRSENFEYRTNLAGFRVFDDYDRWGFNFNDVDSSTLADIVFVNFDIVFSPGGVQWIDEVYLPTLFDENEQPISCPQLLVSCGVTEIDYGVNQTVTNSRGTPSICLGSDPRGHLTVVDSNSSSPPIPSPPPDDADFQAIFVGLNNGDGTGSMDIAVGLDPSVPNPIEGNGG